MQGKTEFFLRLFEGVPAPLAVMGIAALPVAELRLAIPVAIFHYKMSLLQAFGYSVVGNMIPVPIILFFFQWAKGLLQDVWPLSLILKRVDTKVEGHRASFERYGPPALISFVAVPLPMTGAWTGAAAATVFQVAPLQASALLAFGVLIAGAIVTGMCHLGWVALGV